MNKLDALNRLVEIEKTTDAMRRDVVALKSRYASNATIDIRIETTDWKEKGSGTTYGIDPQNLAALLESEIDRLKTEEQTLLARIAKGDI